MIDIPVKGQDVIGLFQSCSTVEEFMEGISDVDSGVAEVLKTKLRFHVLGDTNTAAGVYDLVGQMGLDMEGVQGMRYLLELEQTIDNLGAGDVLFVYPLNYKADSSKDFQDLVRLLDRAYGQGVCVIVHDWLGSLVGDETRSVVSWGERGELDLQPYIDRGDFVQHRSDPVSCTEIAVLRRDMLPPVIRYAERLLAESS